MADLSSRGDFLTRVEFDIRAPGDKPERTVVWLFSDSDELAAGAGACMRAMRSAFPVHSASLIAMTRPGSPYQVAYCSGPSGSSRVAVHAREASVIGKRCAGTLTVLLLGAASWSCADEWQGFDDPSFDELTFGEIAQRSGSKSSVYRAQDSGRDCISIEDNADISSRLKPYKNGERLSLPEDPAEWFEADLRAHVNQAAAKSESLAALLDGGNRNSDAANSVISCGVRIGVELLPHPARDDQYVVFVRMEDASNYSSTAFLGQIDSGLDLAHESRKDLFTNLTKALDAGINAQRGVEKRNAPAL